VGVSALTGLKVDKYLVNATAEYSVKCEAKVNQMRLVYIRNSSCIANDVSVLPHSALRRPR